MAAKNFVFPRKNGTFVFRRRYPRDLAGHFPKPFRWILLDTHSATEAKVLALAKAVEFDQDMARLRCNQSQQVKFVDCLRVARNGRGLRALDTLIFYFVDRNSEAHFFAPLHEHAHARMEALQRRYRRRV